MNYRIDQVVQGIVSYADNEVIGKLPLTGKWVVGTVIAVAANKVDHMYNSLKDNTAIEMLGIIDEEGLIDVEVLIDALKDSANRYGSLTIDVPMLGRLTFSASDVDSLRSYIN